MAFAITWNTRVKGASTDGDKIHICEDRFSPYKALSSWKIILKLPKHYYQIDWTRPFSPTRHIPGNYKYLSSNCFKEPLDNLRQH